MQKRLQSPPKRLFDLHIHSHFSDGKLSVAEIVDLYGQKGFSAIAITDHLADRNTLTGKVTHQLRLSLAPNKLDEYISTVEKEARRAWEKYSMLVVAGVEVTLNSWSKNGGAHFLLLGVKDEINPDSEISCILSQSNYDFAIAAHPIWNESYEFKTQYLWNNRFELQHHFDAWECATAGRFSKEVYLSQLPIVASSDFHGNKYTCSWKSCTYLTDLHIDEIYRQIRLRNIEPVWI